MRRQRVPITALCFAVVACSIISVVMGLRIATYDRQFDRADGRADGIVIEDGIGDVGDIRVRWVDDQGEKRVTRFGIYDTDRYVEGAVFVVRFDPQNPDGAAFPADSYETSPRDDLGAGAALPWLVVITFAVWWVVRAVRARRARRGPPVNARATLLGGTNAMAGPLTALVRSTWIRLDLDGELRMQRVMWDPALATLGHEFPVTVTQGSGVASIVLADGTRLAPIGRLRTEAPDRYRIEDMLSIRASRSDLIVRRQDSPHDAWLRTMAVRAVYGAVLGATVGALVGSITLVWIAALTGAALVVNWWAALGADR